MHRSRKHASGKRGTQLRIILPLVMLLAGPLTSVGRGRRLPDIHARSARFEAAVLIAAVAAYVIDFPAP